MTDAIRHRGPDDCGFYDDGFAFLGHRRLSIIDVAGGHEPMPNEDGTRWIVYNGEIFNHSDLRPDLEAAGHRYASRCDVETILHSYEQYGPDCVQLFRGMFAFAIWDRSQKRLFCARDRLGIKPLYYYSTDSFFAFASEIKALLEHPEISAELNESRLNEYLAFGYLSGEETLFRGIRKLMPGHLLVLDCSADVPSLAIQQYWDVPQTDENADGDDAYWIRETRRRLEQSVELRLMSDVPLGTFLSGGVDSSVVTALVRRFARGTVKTFSVGYREHQYSELNYAAQAAAAVGTEHFETLIDMPEFFNIVPQLIRHEDEPIAWPSSVSLYWVSKLASEHVKVVLTGEGSDEIFGGYERYRWNVLNTRTARAYGIVPDAMRKRLRKFIASSTLLNATIRRKLQHTPLGRDLGCDSLFLDNFYAAFPSEERAALLPYANAADAHVNYRGYWDARPADALLSRMLYADQKTYLVELLMKQDQMSMAASIESRVPFLDHPLVEFTAGMPDRMKIRGATQKYVLKKAFEDILPHEIVFRKKMGFPTPLRDWLRRDAAKSLLDGLLRTDGLLASCCDMTAVRTVLDRHWAAAEDCTDRIWRLLNLQLWGDAFLSRREDECPLITAGESE